MPVTIDQITATQFSPALYQLAQQRESKFSGKIRRETVANAEMAYFDTIAAEDDPTQDTTRHGDTPLTESTFGRRKVVPYKWEKGTQLDSYDLARMQANPTGPVLQSFAMSFGRKKDKIIRDAALGTAAIGKTGATTVNFYDESISINGDGSVTTLGTLAAVATVAAISLAKMELMMKIFNDADVDPDIKKYWAMSTKDIYDLVQLTELKSIEYNAIKAAYEGKVDYYAGFNIFWTNLLTKDAATSTAYRTIAWAQDGIILAYIGDLTTQMAPDPGKKFETIIYSKMDLGAVRMEGAKVHECLNKVAL